jgi:flagellar biosynthesis/type III secretory pathway chaperone
MTTQQIRLYGLVDELLGVLDDQVEQIKVSMDYLDRLRAAVIKRQEDELKGLLETVTDESGRKAVESKRTAICNKLALVLGCSVSQINLSKLRANLPDERSAVVAKKQQEVIEYVEKLNREVTSTGLLLKECSRLNNSLLRKLFGNGSETVTYNVRGKARWEAQRGVVSMRL